MKMLKRCLAAFALGVIPFCGLTIAEDIALHTRPGAVGDGSLIFVEGDPYTCDNEGRWRMVNVSGVGACYVQSGNPRRAHYRVRRGGVGRNYWLSWSGARRCTTGDSNSRTDHLALVQERQWVPHIQEYAGLVGGGVTGTVGMKKEEDIGKTSLF